MGFSIDPLSLILGLVLGGGVACLLLRGGGARAAAQAKAPTLRQVFLIDGML